MSEIRTIRNALLVPILFCTWALCQMGGDSIAPIASALRSQEFDKALQLLAPALQQSPGNAQLWAMQGAAYTGLGRKKEAIASFQRALKISPDYIPALQGAAQIQFDSGDASA